MRGALVFAAILAGCGSSPTGWHVSGGQLRDGEGRAVLLRGLNLAGDHKQKPYFSYQQEADYRLVRDRFGMNAIRFLITWAAVEPEEGVYDAAYLDEVARRMKWAHDAHLSVVIDMHQDVYGEGFAGGDGAPKWTCDTSHYAAFQPRSPWFLSYLDPNVQACYDGLWTRDDLQAHFVEAWRRVAARLSTEEAVIGFDPLNEPHWGSYNIASFEQDRLQPFYSKVTAAVRGEAPRWIAFIEPSSARNLGFSTGLADLPFANVAYSPHSYDSTAEGGGGFDPAHRTQIVDTLARLAGEAKALGAALWIGEYGGLASAPGLADYMSAEYDGAGAVAASTIYWDYGKNDGYAWLATDGSEKPALMSTLVTPYPERVAGDLIDYAFDRVALVATIRVKPDPNIPAPTILSVPEARYPNGWTVDCGGCTVDKSPGHAELRALPAGDIRTITVRPAR